jgi:hypothetical protein
VTQPDAPPSLAAEAVARLVALDLVHINENGVAARAALARYAVAEPILPPSLDLFAETEI